MALTQVAAGLLAGSITSSQISSVAASTLTGTQTIPRGTLPTGSVLQVVYGSTTTQVEASFSSATDLGLSASITPTSSSSKILVLVSANGLASRNSTTYWDGYLVRGSTNLGAFVNFLGNYIGDAGYWGAGLSYLDSPATTSSTTYKLQGIRRSGSGNCVFNITTGNSGTGNISTITLMEISA
jgi:hypothetical protein